MNIEHLKQKYKLSEEDNNRFYNLLKKEIIGARKPNKRICNIIIGQSGSGKSTFSSQLQNEDNSFVIINGDYIRSFHPYAQKLMNDYPKDYCYILLDDWLIWKNRLLKDLLAEGYNFNFETSLKDPSSFLNLLSLLRENNYSFNIYIIALNYIESRLRVLERFFRAFSQSKTGRIIDSDYQTQALDNITNFFENYNIPEMEFVTLLDHNFIPYSVWCGCGQKKLLLDLIRNMYTPIINESFVLRFQRLQDLFVVYESELEEKIKKRLLEQMIELQGYLNATPALNDTSKRWLSNPN